MSDKIYPIGIQNFEDLRNNDCVYIDKTALIYHLTHTNKIYFLSRPRRFGKSLLISTLEAYFQGKKELFEGLAMEKLEKDWIKYPVLHLDLNIEKYDTPESLDKILNDNLVYWESLYGARPSETSFSLRFAGIIQRACEKTGRRVAILVDEYDKLCDDLKAYYDGYHFTHHSIGMYNPFSLLNAFKYKEFGNYWFETGTPTYLVKLLKKHHYDLERMAHEETDSQVLNSIDSESTNPIPVIYQSGYLTIKGYDEEFGMYRLGFPNREVEEGFVRFLLPFYANVNKVESPFEIQKFVREVRSGDYDSFFLRLQSFFADTTYEAIREQELHYENVLFIVFKLVGFYTQVEYHTSKGRIDLVLQTDKFIYVIEFKLDGTAEEALQQIHDKHYALPFASDRRKLFKIGVNFSAETRNIEKWIVEE